MCPVLLEHSSSIVTVYILNGFGKGKKMEKRKQPLGFLVKQINNVFEKDLNRQLKTIGITSSQCAVLDYLFHTNEEEVNQRDVERSLNLKNPTVTGLLKRLDVN